MSKKLSRRRFIQSTAASTAAVSIPSILHCRSPSSKLNVGLIGVGGRGRGHVNACKKENIVSLCDVNYSNLKGALRIAPNARSYKDLRDFCGKLDDIDAVVVSTTEHTHAFATLPALKAGKHVYCEKPLTRDVHECRIITEAAAKAKVQTQMGTQIHAGENFRRVVATEISRTSVASANVNLEANAVANAVVARMSAEEFSAALAGEKTGRRVAALALDEHTFTTALVDPPRAGLDAHSCEQLKVYERIVYISCNPDTLEANLEQLSATHVVTRFALFDQFPYTDHCECGVLLERRAPAARA